MTDRDEILLQLLVPLAATSLLFLFLPRIRRNVVKGAVLAASISVGVILIVLLWQVGVTSTLPLGVIWTAALAIAVSFRMMALLKALIVRT